METATDVLISPTKIKKQRLDSGSENVPSKEGSKHEPKKVIPNGTGGSADSSPVKSMKEKSKAIKISKVSKVIKKEPKTPVKEVGKVESSGRDSPGSSQEESFHGFDGVLTEEQSGKQDVLYRILQKLTAATSQEQDIEMTIDDGHLSDSDSAKDSDQMEIDIQADKEPNSDSYATKDNAVDNSDNSSSKNEGREFKTETSAVDNSAAPSPLPTEKVSAKVEYCGGCDKAVDDAEEGICCDGQCERWFHLRCSGLNQSEYDELGRDENAKWACNKCSGKPPPVLQSEIKPLLSVRKDLTNPVTPTTTQMPKRKSIKSDGSGKSRVFDISNPAFLKPFDYGWKRELVFRSTNDSGGRRQGDVYYYTPKGKKLRSLREISEHVVGTDLTMDNFTFWKDSIGVDDPEKEIIRDAKFKLVNKESASPIPKKVVTPKVPKTPKVTPKLTATVTPLDNSGSTPSAPAPASITPKVSASVTPRIVFKGNAKASTGPKFKVTPSKSIMPGQAQKIVITKGSENTTEDPYVELKKKESKEGKQLKSVVPEQRRSSGSGNVENLAGDMEISTRNNFRRYGLLANRTTARNRNSKSSSSSCSSSSSSSDESSSEQKQRLQSPSAKSSALRVLVKNSSPKSAADNTQVEPTLGDKSKSSTPSPKKDSHPSASQVKRSGLIHPIIEPSLMSDLALMPSLGKRRPSPTEIQFRPSNPSSYGCQTSPTIRGPMAAASSVYHTNVLDCQSPCETVLIVESSPSAQPFRSPKKTSKFGGLIRNNNDCSIQIVNVESLKCTSPYERSYYMSANSEVLNIGAMKDSGRNNVDFQRDSPCSDNSSLSDEIPVVVLDEDQDQDDNPPSLVRNSPPPQMRRSVSSPSRSPPSLQPILPPPPLTLSPNARFHQLSHAKPKSTTSVDRPSTSLEQHRIDDNERIMYRKAKRERFYKRVQQKMKLEKQRRLLLKRKSEEKRLSVKYLKMKVELKEMKMELLRNDLQR